MTVKGIEGNWISAFSTVEVFVPLAPKQPTQKELIVANTKKSFDIAMKLAQKTLEGIARPNREGTDVNVAPCEVDRLEGLLDFMKKELTLYKDNMESADNVHSYSTQLE